MFDAAEFGGPELVVVAPAPAGSFVPQPEPLQRDVQTGEDAALGGKVAVAQGVCRIWLKWCSFPVLVDVVRPLPAEVEIVLGAVLSAQHKRGVGYPRWRERLVCGDDRCEVAQPGVVLLTKPSLLSGRNFQPLPAPHHALELVRDVGVFIAKAQPWGDCQRPVAFRRVQTQGAARRIGNVAQPLACNVNTRMSVHTTGDNTVGY